MSWNPSQYEKWCHNLVFYQRPPFPGLFLSSWWRCVVLVMSPRRSFGMSGIVAAVEMGPLSDKLRCSFFFLLVRDLRFRMFKIADPALGRRGLCLGRGESGRRFFFGNLRSLFSRLKPRRKVLRPGEDGGESHRCCFFFGNLRSLFSRLRMRKEELLLSSPLPLGGQMGSLLCRRCLLLLYLGESWITPFEALFQFLSPKEEDDDRGMYAGITVPS